MALAADEHLTHPGTLTDLDRLYAEARRIRRAILNAEDEEEAALHRHALDEVEDRIESFERAQACEGFPPGK